jgi:hypothetical protein
MENFDSFFNLLASFVAICFILWQFGIFCGRLLHIPHFGVLHQEKSGNPALDIEHCFDESFCDCHHHCC